MLLSIIDFLGAGLMWYRIGQDSGIWMIDQKMLSEYAAYRIIDRARRDREAHE